MENSNNLIENMKKALMEMILLKFLTMGETHIGNISDLIKEYSHGNISVVFPYGALYRLLNAGYIIESKKAVTDGRRRQLYKITDEGMKYLEQLENDYGRFTGGLNMIYKKINENTKHDHDE